MKRPAGLSLVIGTIVFCVAIWILESRTRILQRIYDDRVLDNYNHYLSCDEMPSESQVRQVMQAYEDTIERIEQINPGFIGAEVGTAICPGKADILFWYGTHQERLLIEKIIDGDTFHGIPYRLENR